MNRLGSKQAKRVHSMMFSSGRFYSISLLTPIRINLHVKIGQMGLRSWRNYGAACVRVGGGEAGGGGKGGEGGRRGEKWGEGGDRGLIR